jgi:hypothetical protein
LGACVGILLNLIKISRILLFAIKLQDIAMACEGGQKILIAALYHIKHRFYLVDGRLRLLQNIVNRFYGGRRPIVGIDGQYHFARLAGGEIVGLERGHGLLLAGHTYHKQCNHNNADNLFHRTFDIVHGKNTK